MNDLAIKNETEISTQTENPYLAMMNKMVETGNMEQLEKMMELQERWEAGEAKKAYVRAMNLFKANAPTITKDAKGHNSKYAKLCQVADKVAKTLSEYGLSHRWETKQEGDLITVACITTHELGHSESVSLSAGPDTSGSKNSIQAIGSTVSYLERYTLLAATGLAAQDQDYDGGKPLEVISEKQLSEIVDMAADKGVELEKIAAAYNVSDLSQLPASQFKKVISQLERKEAK